MLSWRLARRLAPPVVVGALALSTMFANPVATALDAGPSTTAPTTTAPSATPAPSTGGTSKDAPATKKKAAPAPKVEVKQTAVPAVATSPASTHVVAELSRTSTHGYGMIGVTWDSGTGSADTKVSVKTRTDGKWSGWQALDYDPDSVGDGPHNRPGTDPLWVGSADGVAVRVEEPSGNAPQGIRVVTIDPGKDTASTSVTGASTATSDGGVATATNATYSTTGVVDGTAQATAASDGTPTFTPKPTIITRAQWGASKPTACDSPRVADQTMGVIVHHTAGSNTYTKAQSAQIVRGIQAYHMKGHGWCDIGYNFLVDKYGQIFEGRAGGVDRQVRAAHSGNFDVNTYDMGVSMMGNYDVIKPQTALKDAMVKLIGWRLGTNYLPATGTYKLDGLTLNRIAGHRNVIKTECPGKYGYAWLSESGGLRDRVKAYLAKYSSPIKTLAAKLGKTVTGPVAVGEAGVAGGRRTIFDKTTLYSASTTATAHAVSGAYLTAYSAAGGPGGSLGFPTSDAAATSTTGVSVQKFAKGAIYRVTASGTTKTYTLTNPISSAYTTLKAAAGKLGAPRSSVTTTSGVSKATFAGGTITYTASTKKVVAKTSAGTTLPITSTTTPSTPTTPTTTSSTSQNVGTPTSAGSVAVAGHGYGHGIGLSQYGAQEAAVKGLTAAKILSYYYPGTTTATKSGLIRVLISKDTSADVDVRMRSGLVLHEVSSGLKRTLPATVSGKAVDRWRIEPDPSAKTTSILQYHRSDGWLTATSTKPWKGAAQFESPGTIALVLPDGSATSYRGALRSSPPSTDSTDRNTVNVVSYEQYTQGVVASEMPSSWKPAALQAQAVAARTYGVHAIDTARYYDICDTTSCQVYKGVSGEAATATAAVTATKGHVLTYGGRTALTQFSSSSGGYTSAGSATYLPAKADAYDDYSGNPNHDWTATVKVAALEKAYPAIGTLKTLQVTKRTGAGSYGGRVTTVRLTGSKGTTSISGTTARSLLGLKSNFFVFSH